MILDQSPFYAESGGQVADHGMLRSLPDQHSNGAASALVIVNDVQKGAGGDLVVHHGRVEEGQVHVDQQVPHTIKFSTAQIEPRHSFLVMVRSPRHNFPLCPTCRLDEHS